MRSRFRKAFLTTVAIASCGLSSLFAQSGSYHLPSSSTDDSLEALVRETAESYDLKSEKKDSLISFWLPLYKRTAGISRSCESRPEILMSDTTTIHRRGSHGSVSTMYTREDVLTFSSQSRVAVTAFDLGSFSSWSEAHEVPEYAQTMLFESLQNYFNDVHSPDSSSQDTSSANETNVSSENRRSATSVQPAVTVGSYEELEKRFESAHAPKDLRKPRPWTLDVLMGVSNGEASSVELGLARDLLSFSSDHDASAFRLKASYTYCSETINDYLAKRTIQESELPLGQSPDLYEKTVETAVVEGTRRENDLGRLLAGVRFGASDRLNFSVYAGAMLERASYHDLREYTITSTYRISSGGSAEKTDFSHTPETPASKPDSYSLEESLQVTLSYHALGITASMHDLESPGFSIGCSLNF
ncbi:MAG: hypothetical protein ACLFTH_01045 [Candidatus Woesearchaeota archaeon]